MLFAFLATGVTGAPIICPRVCNAFVVSEDSVSRYTCALSTVSMFSVRVYLTFPRSAERDASRLENEHCNGRTTIHSLAPQICLACYLSLTALLHKFFR